MRHYETDSSPAAARILALTMLADGGLDHNELDALMRSDLVRRLGIGTLEFERILREYCDDLMMSAHYLDGMRLKLADEVFELLLEDIADPALQRAVLRTMQDIVSADGVETGAEVEVLARALEKWGARSAPGRIN
ncbi:MAG: TerB family tellurite resistance protein [Thauera phenolivorans]|uniref:TerB family tellurite resistance protein n=1 Tax=Thauera phenolivorans TaxID=1792543 RepID=A0A7X7R7Y5_9RHOO|nr:TerB family tellurite resistance protein [Thauera phenolivorans]NLF53803.1 TerB family tellurite resistance protein [Thauera phenolivorans]